MFPLQTANEAYIQRKIHLSGFYAYPDGLPDKWSSTVSHNMESASILGRISQRQILVTPSLNRK
jgi:hypothetical protein